MPLKHADDIESLDDYKRFTKKELSLVIRAETPYVWLTNCTLKGKLTPLFFIKPDKNAIADLMKANPKAKRFAGFCSREEGDLLRLADKKVPKALNKHLNSLKEASLIDIVFVPADAEDDGELGEAVDAAAAAAATAQGQQPAAAPAAPKGLDPAALGQRLNDLKAKFAKLTLKADVKALIDKLFVLAESHRAKQNWPNLSQTLDAAEAQLKKLGVPGATPPPQPATGPAKPPMEDFRKKWDVAKKAWREASDAVDSQITRLQGALKNSGDEDLEEIAEFGLNGVTGNFKTPLMAALLNIDGAGNPDALKKAAGNAGTVIKGFRQHLDSDESVEACDDNPFGVKVTIRQTLSGALTQLEQALSLAA